jgi:hypothetical protein
VATTRAPFPAGCFGAKPRLPEVRVNAQPARTSYWRQRAGSIFPGQWVRAQ